MSHLDRENSDVSDLEIEVERLREMNAELLEALKKAHLDAIAFLNYGNFNGANFNTESSSCVDGHVEWDTGYIVDAVARATGESK